MSSQNQSAAVGWTLLFLTCIVAFIPGLGFITWLIAAPICFVVIILGIVGISKNEVASGALLLLAALIAAPLVIFFAPILSTLVVGAAVATKATPRAIAASTPMNVLADSPQPEPAPIETPRHRDPQAEMQRAIAKHPELKVEGSMLNREFVARVQRYRREKPEFFEQPEWPTKLADEAKANLPK